MNQLWILFHDLVDNKMSTFSYYVNYNILIGQTRYYKYIRYVSTTICFCFFKNTIFQFQFQWKKKEWNLWNLYETYVRRYSSIFELCVCFIYIISVKHKIVGKVSDTTILWSFWISFFTRCKSNTLEFVFLLNERDTI